MFKFIWRQRKPVNPAAQDWRHNPMGHPALREMSLVQLADLPMVAEVPMRVMKVDVSEDCRRHVSRVKSVKCTVSR